MTEESFARAKAAPRRVLVMEDDVPTADLISSLLEEDGYEVEVATHAQYGLLVADTFDPQLILLDVNLAGLPGAEMKQVLRAAPQFAGRFLHTQILYLGDHDHIVQQRFHSLPETPMTHYIMKPLDAHELRFKVRRAFDEVQSANEKAASTKAASAKDTVEKSQTQV